MGWRVGTFGNVSARLPLIMKTIVIGLGNPILGDDGVGWKVAEEVRRLLTSPAGSPTGVLRKGDGSEGEIHVEFLSLGGISLMEHLIGYERAIIIDALDSDKATGSVIVSKLSELPDYSALHTTSTHDTSLQNALRLGKAMGINLPDDITVVGITTDHVYDFGEQLSLPVAKVIPEATKIVIDLL